MGRIGTYKKSLWRRQVLLSFLFELTHFTIDVRSKVSNSWPRHIRHDSLQTHIDFKLFKYYL